MRRTVQSTFVAFVVAASAAHVSAQATRPHRVAFVAGEWANGLGDVDGDGHADFFFKHLSRLFLFSGKEGRLLRRVEADGAVGVGDVDADGFDDVAVIQAGRVRLVSAATWAVLWTLDAKTPAGTRVVVAAAGDLNDDGRPDVVIGNPQASSPALARCGSVSLVSGRSGELHHVVYGTEKDEGLGRFVVAYRGERSPAARGALVWSSQALIRLDSWSGERRELAELAQRSIFASAGDINADEIPDALVAVGSPAKPTAVRVLSGSDGSHLRTLRLRDPGPDGTSVSRVRLSAAGAGDADGDGHADVLLGDPACDPSGKRNGGGVCQVLSGKDGSVLWSAGGQDRSTGLMAFYDFGWAVADAGDVDADGCPDWLVCGDYWKNIFYVYSSQTTAPLYEIDLRRGEVRNKSGETARFPVD